MMVISDAARVAHSFLVQLGDISAGLDARAKETLISLLLFADDLRV